jgi:hypothetical protein
MSGTSPTSFNLEAARKWMLSLYDQSVGLFRCAPYALGDRDRFWLYNDNYLVFSTLKYYSVVDAKFPPSRITILDGQVVPHLRNQNFVETIEQRDDKVIMNEFTPVRSDAPIPVGEYADIDFYDAINKFNSGDRTGAANAFLVAEKTSWDGTGFKDKSWIDKYQLFKNCVYLIAARRIGVNAQYATQCEGRIIDAQKFALSRPDFPLQSGGVMTEYDSDLNPAGDTNQETTTLAYRCFQ